MGLKPKPRTGINRNQSGETLLGSIEPYVKIPSAFNIRRLLWSRSDISLLATIAVLRVGSCSVRRRLRQRCAGLFERLLPNYIREFARLGSFAGGAFSVVCCRVCHVAFICQI